MDAKKENPTFGRRVWTPPVDVEKSRLRKYLNKYNGINGKPLIKIASKLWIAKRYKILDSYMQIVGVAFDTFNANKPVIAAQSINNWISSATNHKIKQINTESGGDLYNPDRI